MSPRVASSQPRRHHSAKSCPPPADGSQICPSSSSYGEERWIVEDFQRLENFTTETPLKFVTCVHWYSQSHFGTHHKHPADFLCTSSLPRSPLNIIIKNMYDKRQLEARPGQHAKSGQDISHQQPASQSGWAGELSVSSKRQSVKSWATTSFLDITNAIIWWRL